MDMWCFEAFLDRRTLDEVIQIRIQLKNMAERLLQAPLKAANFGDPACHTNIRKALARSFFIARQSTPARAMISTRLYTTTGRQEFTRKAPLWESTMSG